MTFLVSTSCGFCVKRCAPIVCSHPAAVSVLICFIEYNYVLRYRVNSAAGAFLCCIVCVSADNWPPLS